MPNMDDYATGYADALEHALAGKIIFYPIGLGRDYCRGYSDGTLAFYDRNPLASESGASS